MAAAAILQLLAPAQGCWLRVGDDAAALAFIAIVARKIGANIAQLASVAMRGDEVSWQSIPNGQRAMINELATLASGYMVLSTPQDSDERPQLDTPARQLAAWLLMLDSCMDRGQA